MLLDAHMFGGVHWSFRACKHASHLVAILPGSVAILTAICQSRTGRFAFGHGMLSMLFLWTCCPSEQILRGVFLCSLLVKRLIYNTRNNKPQKKELVALSLVSQHSLYKRSKQATYDYTTTRKFCQANTWPHTARSVSEYSLFLWQRLVKVETKKLSLCTPYTNTRTPSMVERGAITKKNG